MLLVTGAVPTNQRRLAWLADLLPLAAIEVSHFLASVVGLTFWLGLFVYRHEAHSTQLWWQFALAGTRRGSSEYWWA